MTPGFLMATMAFLSLMLVVLSWRLLRMLRKKVTPDQPQAAMERSQEEPQPKPVPELRAPATAGRTRRLVASSDGGGDPGPMQRLFHSGVYAEVEAKLEQAFDLYAKGRISLDTYEVLVSNESEAIRRARLDFEAKERSGEASPDMLGRQREEIETAEVAIKWCIDWAADLRSASAQNDPDPGSQT